MAEDKKTGQENLGGGGSSENTQSVEDLEKTVLQNERQLGGEGKGPDAGPYLIIVQGPRQGMKFPLIAGDNIIGRLMGSEVMLDDHSVSRQHAIVTQTREGWTIEDKGSKNGTFVNGRQITEKVNIGHGDVVQMGIYSLRLITRYAPEEEIKPLPPDWEGKTMMVSAPLEEDTATLADKKEKKAVEAAEEVSEKEEGRPEELIVLEEEKKEKKKRPLWWNILLALILVVVLGGGGAFAYFQFFYKPPKPVKPVKKPVVEKPVVGEPETPTVPGVPGQPAVPGQEPAVPGQAPQAPAQPLLPSEIPVFLDFASSPLPAAVTFQGKSYGQTPIKIQEKLEVDKEYTAEGEFNLQDINEKYKEEVRFKVTRDEPLVPILFKGPIGALKVMEIPKNTTLYLEAYFVYDPFNAKTSKLANVVFGKPLYVPFGKYIVELRVPKELAGSGEFVEDIRYKREILITEDNPIYMLKVMDQDMNEFPVEIISVPPNANVFMDANKVGVTPYKGVFPLGEHTLSLSKDGYFEHKQDLKMDMNVPFKTEIVLKTTVAGEYINAGTMLIQQGRYKEAIDKLSEVFKQNPAPGELAQTKYLIGSSFVHLGDLASAEGYFKQALEDPEMKHAAMLGLVSVYNGLGRKSEAVQNLVEVLLNSKDEQIKKEANALFQQVSPLRSIMYVLTDPAGATVYLNDKKIEEKTPLILPDLTLGNYKVRIEKDGYLAQDLSINFSVNEFNPVVVKLRPVPE